MARSPDVMNTPAYKRLGRGLSGVVDGGERDVMGYAPPKGPTNILDPKGPGLHGDNEGKAGEQGDSAEGYERHQSSGKARLQGDSPRMCGSQGRY